MSAQPYAHTQRTASLRALCLALLCFAPLFFLSCGCAPHVRQPLALSLVAFSNNKRHTHTHTHALLSFVTGGGGPTTTTGSP
eukprot:COSAG06_NODE_43698_length_369_cov_2.951852_1_plen_81_part_10